MGYYISGISLIYLRYVPGTSLVYPKYITGLSHVYFWYILGILQIYYRHTLSTYQANIRDISVISLLYQRYILGEYQVPLGISQVYLGHISDIS